jgi:ketosteroid isomerase-like protein
MKKVIKTIALILIITSCQKVTTSRYDKERSKREIIITEKDFEKKAAVDGIAEAFAFYAADRAVINRGNLIFGKSAIRYFYEHQKNNDALLKWQPDFVDISSSCDLGYTYGKYTFSYKDSLGKVNESKGFFHTVWKKQADGKWKFVWD